MKKKNLKKLQKKYCLALKIVVNHKKFKNILQTGVYKNI